MENLAAAENLPHALLAYEEARRLAVERSQNLGRISADWFTRVGDALDLPLSRFAASLLTREERFGRGGGT